MYKIHKIPKVETIQNQGGSQCKCHEHCAYITRYARARRWFRA